MTGKEQCPDRLEPRQGEISFDGQGKDTLKLSNRQRKVYELLHAKKHSTAGITIKTGYCDPRSYIRDLREKGVNIQDEWVQKNDVRYKQYWINDIVSVGEVIDENFKYLTESVEL